MINDNSEENKSKLHYINAEYIRYLKLKESILKQKTQLQWFREGDANSKYFHALMRGRRRRLFIHKISNDPGDWIQKDENIAKTTCDHFKDIFSGKEKRVNKEVLNCIPRMVKIDQNRMLQVMPTIEELK